MVKFCGDCKNWEEKPEISVKVASIVDEGFEELKQILDKERESKDMILSYGRDLLKNDVYNILRKHQEGALPVGVVRAGLLTCGLTLVLEEIEKAIDKRIK